jgi:Glyoxalase-like domain
VARGVTAGWGNHIAAPAPPIHTDRDQDAELERLLKLGARPADIGQTGEESWPFLADPEGNEFYLLKTRLDPL